MIAVVARLKELENRSRADHLTFFAARNGQPVCEQDINRILFGRWGTEELVACRTAENCLEIHCHGGPVAIQRILSDLASLGVEVISWQELLANSLEFRPRPGSHQTSASHEHEYAVALAQARTFQAAEQIWVQRNLAPNFWEELEEFTNSSAEAAADAPTGKLSEKQSQQVQMALRWSQFGLHLTTPWTVVIGGLPNAGKSSLMNALLGYERAIVFDQPGTTRDVLSGETAIAGWSVVIRDTAGQRATRDQLESAGIDLATKALQQADLQILLFDQSQSANDFTRQLLQRFPQALKVLNKIDLPAHPDWQEQANSDWLNISCRQQTGIVELLTEIARRLVPELPAANTIFPVTPRQLQLLENWR